MRIFQQPAKHRIPWGTLAGCLILGLFLCAGWPARAAEPTAGTAVEAPQSAPAGEVHADAKPGMAPPPPADAKPEPARERAKREQGVKPPAGKTREAEASPAGGPLAVKDLTIKVEADAAEKVFVEFDRFHTPTVFSLEKDKPRIVIDIRGATTVKRELLRSVIPGKGRMIRQIRTHYDGRTRTLRIVLDMEPARNYRVNQLFYKAENIYALEIFEEKQTPRSP